jgi:hypothetical protein
LGRAGKFLEMEMGWVAMGVAGATASMRILHRSFNGRIKQNNTDIISF